MWSRWLIDTGQWEGESARWEPAFGPAPGPRITWRFSHGFAAVQRNDMIAARADLAALQAARAESMARAAKAHDSAPETIEDQKRARVLDLELQGAIQLHEGKGEGAVTLLRQATAVEDGMAYAFGPPYIDKPSHELLGEMLLQLGRGKDAVGEFQKALRVTPRRPVTLQGLGRAYAAAGMPDQAGATWKTLIEIWHGADATFPGLDEARRGAGQ